MFCLRPEVLRHILVYIKGVLGGLVVKTLSGTQGLVRGMTGMNFWSPVASVEGLVWCVYVDYTTLTDT